MATLTPARVAIPQQPRRRPHVRGFASIFRRLKRKLPREMDFKLHRARNTAITNWLRNGNNLHTTMKLAGHKSPKVTERYAGEFTDDELRKLVRPSFTAIYGRRSA